MNYLFTLQKSGYYSSRVLQIFLNFLHYLLICSESKENV